MERADAPVDAQLVVLNTCTVTASADQDARAAIRRIHRENPACKILVTGCYAQRAPEELATLPGVTRVIGNSHKQHVAAVAAQTYLVGSSSFVPLRSLEGSDRLLVGNIFAHTELLAAPVFEAGDHASRTRPNLKIQDGCNNRCSFCVIPFVRGRSRSAPAQQIVEQVRRLAERYQEVVLSGINLGRWGREPGGTMRLADLVRRLLEETPIERLRLSSIETMDW